MARCVVCKREYQAGCDTCGGTGDSRWAINGSCDCCECGSALTLYEDEGIITPSDDGIMLTNQTGGCCCNHPRIRGFFAPRPLPGCVKDFAEHRDHRRVDMYLRAAGIPWKVSGGEEAWLWVETPEGERILVWPNSD